MSEYIINFNSPTEKALILSKLRELSGMYRIEIVRHRTRRTDAQNRLYWPAFIEPITDYMNGQGMAVTEGDVHEWFKSLFLRKSIVSTTTGELIGETIRSTTDLNIEEFSRYLDQIAVVAAEKFGLRLESNRT